MILLDILQGHNIDIDLLMARASFQRSMFFLMERTARNMVKHFKQEFFSGRPKLISRTGTMRRSLGYRVLRLANDMGFEITTTHPGFMTHVTGKHIYGTAMAVPLPNAISYRGLKKWKSPLRQHGLFQVVKGPIGTAFLKHTRTGKITHVLRQHVYVPPRINPKLTGEAFLLFEFAPQARAIVDRVMAQVGTRKKRIGRIVPSPFPSAGF